ncbi:MAG: FAD-dependent oxidoreductase [Candidatus Latescibacterota bacterium]
METVDLECDVLVVGGGMGGVAAALAACRAGQSVCLTEENPWLGGQCTSQGVSALDEHPYIETFGGTASYYDLRERIRSHYRDCYELSAKGLAAPFLNPGDGWVSRLCFEPRVGLAVLVEMLLPYVASRRLRIFYGARARSATLAGDRIVAVTADQPTHARTLAFHPAYVLDATELGDLLPLLGIPYFCGAEARAQTGEPDARSDGPAPGLAQAFTLPFVVDFRPGEDHTIPRPADYERNRVEQPYTLTLRYDGRDLTYRVFEPAPGLPGPFWTYRRILAADNFVPGQVPGDLAMINWPGNDFRGGSLLDCPPAEREPLLQRARDLSLGFLYWLQTEVPRDDGRGRGYPELRLRPDVLGTVDGLSQHPYVRESRRIQAWRTVRQQDVLASLQPGPRAAPFTDSVGLGFYPVDIHPLPGDVAATGPTRPFQIPLGALVPRDLTNLVAACKNIGTTHMTNGCYRLHPVEWNIGEAAGTLAAWCLGQTTTPAAVLSDPDRLRAFQVHLLQEGVPLYWYVDLPAGHPSWGATQILALSGVWPGQAGNLRFGPDEVATPGEVRDALAAASLGPGELGLGTETRARGQVALTVAERRFGMRQAGQNE